MNSQGYPLLWVVLGASLWGTDTVLRRPITAYWSSPQIVFLEHLILTAVLAGAVWRSRAQWRRLGRKQWAALLGVAWGGSALATMCFTEAIRAGNPSAAVLLQKSQPLFAALLARGLLREPLGAAYWKRLGPALCGAYLISFGDRPLAPFAGQAALGPALLAVAAAALWGGSTVLGRFLLGALSFQAMTALRITLALPPLALLALLQAKAPAVPASPGPWLSLLGLALVPGLLALLAYYRGLKRSRASLAAIAELAFPATAALLNWLVLDVRIAWLQAAGFALLCAVILSLNLRRLAPAKPRG